MEIRSRIEDRGVAVVEVSGEVDACTAPEMQKALLDAAGRPHTILLADLSGVTFLSSSGLRALFRASDAERGRGQELRVFGLRPSVRRVIELAGFDAILRLAATRDEAEEG